MTDKQTEALKLALEALENPDALDEYNRSLPDVAITAIREALAEQPAQPQEPVAVKQIAEALRQVGLTLVRANGGFLVMDLGQIEAQNTPPAQQQEMGK